MDYKAITDTFTELALKAGEVILEVYASPDFEVKSKSDESPVTEADTKADAHISAGLRAAFPDIALVTEEQAATHDMDGTSPKADFATNAAAKRGKSNANFYRVFTQ